MNNISYTDKNELMKKIMQYEFAANELVLFLDTHPKDMKALEMHEAVADKLTKLKAAYSKKYGPLTANEASGGECWNWIESPWPWEN